MIAMVSRFVTIPYKRPHYKYQVSYDKSYTTWQVLFAFHQERCLRLSLGDGSILSAMKSYVPLILLSCPWGPCRPLGRRRRQLLGRVFPSWSSRPCRPRRWSQGSRLIFCWSRWWERGRVQRWQEWLSKRILPLFWKLFEKKDLFPMNDQDNGQDNDVPFLCLSIWIWSSYVSENCWKRMKLTLQSGRRVRNFVFCSPLSAWCSQKPGKQLHFTKLSNIKCIFNCHQHCHL